MYPIEVTNQFIELRSRDISLQRIAEQLGIKSTAIIRVHIRNLSPGD
jgi:hypothetical protein